MKSFDFEPNDYYNRFLRSSSKYDTPAMIISLCTCILFVYIIMSS